MTEPCAVAYSATIAPGLVKPGDRIVVYGPGPIGVLAVAMARLAGAEVALVGLEKDRTRLEIAKSYGCEVIIGSATEWAKSVDGLGADGVVDAAGVSASLKQALEVVRPDGWISKVGWGPQPLDFSLDPLVAKNVNLQGSFSHNWPMWERVLRVFAINDWHNAFEKMASGEILKSVIKPE
jgi:alcohol dehydrogenase/L-iditol 2-dehydrogenase